MTSVVKPSQKQTGPAQAVQSATNKGTVAAETASKGKDIIDTAQPGR